jgi:hypothetical protein
MNLVIKACVHPSFLEKEVGVWVWQLDSLFNFVFRI